MKNNKHRSLRCESLETRCLMAGPPGSPQLTWWNKQGNTTTQAAIISEAKVELVDTAFNVMNGYTLSYALKASDGTVVDSNPNQPLQLWGLKDGIWSDIENESSFKNLPAGTYTQVVTLNYSGNAVSSISNTFTISNPSSAPVQVPSDATKAASDLNDQGVNVTNAAVLTILGPGNGSPSYVNLDDQTTLIIPANSQLTTNVIMRNGATVQGTIIGAIMTVPSGASTFTPDPDNVPLNADVDASSTLTVDNSKGTVNFETLVMLDNGNLVFIGSNNTVVSSLYGTGTIKTSTAPKSSPRNSPLMDSSSTGAMTLTITGSDYPSYLGTIADGDIPIALDIQGDQGLRGTNTYTGGTNVEGLLGINSDSALGDTSGALTIHDGGTVQALADMTLSGSRSIITADDGGTATLDTNGCSVTIPSAISGYGGVAFTGGGTVTLSGTNIYAGGTTVSDGTTLIVATPDAIPDGTSLTVGDASAFNSPSPGFPDPRGPGENDPVNPTSPPTPVVTSLSSTISAPIVEADTLTYTTTFNTNVWGVSAANFAVSGPATITSVKGLGSVYTISVAVSGSGTAGLQMVNGTGIHDAGNMPLNASNLPIASPTVLVNPTLETLNSSSFSTSVTQTAATLLTRDGAINRSDIVQILQSAIVDGAVSDQALQDLQLLTTPIISGELHAPNYVATLASDIINGSPANAHYQGQPLGNLDTQATPQARATAMNELIEKWYYGSDVPAACVSYTVTAGSLYGSAGAPSSADMAQGGLGDCYFVAAVGALADSSTAAIENAFIDNGDGTYTVRFYAGSTPDYVTVNTSLPGCGAATVYAHPGPDGSWWLPLLEKAYAEWNETGREGRDGTNSYAGLTMGNMGAVDQQLLGNMVSTYCPASGGAAAQQAVIAAIQSGKAVTAAIFTDGNHLFTQLHLVSCHAYDIDAYDADPSSPTYGTFELKNPWGFYEPERLSWDQVAEFCSWISVADPSTATALSPANVDAYFGSLANQGAVTTRLPALAAL